MPYLHLETDRKRETMTRLIEEESKNERWRILKQNEEETIKRKKEREGLRPGKRLPIVNEPSDKPSQGLANAIKKTDGISRFGPGQWPIRLGFARSLKRGRRREDDIRLDRYGRLLVPNALGQFLVDAARLFEAMSVYRDKRMVEEYLYVDAPLHPRRTLDQSYYWTLNTTSDRDRDQVIYRGTNMDSTFAHVLRMKDEGKKKFRRRLRFWDRSVPRCEWHWKGHYAKEASDDSTDTQSKSENDTVPSDDRSEAITEMEESGTGCEQCRSDIKMISRVVMVRRPSICSP